MVPVSYTHLDVYKRQLVDWTIRPHIMAVPGVADVNVLGGDVRQFQILVEPSKLIRYNLSIQEVLAATARVTGVRGAGYIENNNQRDVYKRQLL